MSRPTRNGTAGSCKVVFDPWKEVTERPLAAT
jgi:hypothetical protein